MLVSLCPFFIFAVLATTAAANAASDDKSVCDHGSCTAMQSDDALPLAAIQTSLLQHAVLPSSHNMNVSLAMLNASDGSKSVLQEQSDKPGSKEQQSKSKPQLIVKEAKSSKDAKDTKDSSKEQAKNAKDTKDSSKEQAKNVQDTKDSSKSGKKSTESNKDSGEDKDSKKSTNEAKGKKADKKADSKKEGQQKDKQKVEKEEKGDASKKEKKEESEDSWTSMLMGGSVLVPLAFLAFGNPLGGTPGTPKNVEAPKEGGDSFWKEGGVGT